MNSGKRDQLVTIERKTTVEDEYGGETEAWTTYATAWAQIFYGKGDERRQAAQLAGSQAATFQVLNNSLTRGLLITDRIVWGDGNWDITSIAYPTRASVEITAVRAV